ncbi:hypothetical protein TorRG33x02_169640 [Trema orientale]|uniref:Uncharacterized protein n=1 Tax=Trema orientale TaxID=63057 RepID=A0A2P5ENR3_TREOI|nr:hypothetical protein TorRG33x02_169640 [Trema orientale]
MNPSSDNNCHDLGVSMPKMTVWHRDLGSLGQFFTYPCTWVTFSHL